MRAALGVVAVGVVGGELAAARGGPPELLLAVAGMAPVLAWPLRRRWPALLLVALGCAALALGGWRMRGVVAPRLPADHVARMALPVRTTVVARVVVPPERRAGRTVLYVEAESVELGGALQPVSGRIRLAVRRPGRRWRYGDRLVATTTLRRPRNFANPGSFDYVAHLARRGVHVTAFVWDGGTLQRLRSRPHGARAALERWRQRIGVRIARAVRQPESAVLRALVVGDEGGLSPALRDAFARAGVVHVLSVSGLHIALVAGAAVALVRLLLGASERLLLAVDVARLAAVLGLVPVAVYAALAGLGVATLRSALMAGAAVVALQLGRRTDVPRALATAALVLSLAWPGAPLEIAFQLSFASVLSIACGARWCAGPSAAGEPGRRLARLGRSLRAAGVASLAAGLGTAPLTAFHFHQVSLVGVVANPLVIPVFGVAVLGPGLVGALVEPLWPAAATALFTVAGWVLRPGVAVVSLLGTWPAAAVDVPIPTVLELALVYGLLATLAPMPRRLRRLLLAVALAGLVVDAGWWARERLARGTLRVTFLDVGQGDAAVVELPDGGVVVVDAGGFPGGDFDTGAAVVAPFLWARKIVRLDALAMTHAHPDHSGGLAYLLGRFRPREFWWTGVPGEGTSWEGLRTALAASGATAVRILAADGRHAPLAGAAQVLHPPDAHQRSLNDSSLTLRFAHGDVAVLLTGDIEARAEERLLAAPAALRAAVLKVPHHGSRTSSTRAFVDAVAPAVAVISVGADNRYRLPVPEVEARYRSRGTCVLRTDRCGAVTIETDGRALRVATARPDCGCGVLPVRPPG